MNKYELTAILDGKVSPAKVKALKERIEKLIATFGGKVEKVSDWGVKDLAYKIAKSTSGYYLLFELELDGPSNKGLDLKLKMEEEVVRYLLIRV